MPHTVKRGETLSIIAKAHGITLAQILDANPEFKGHPDIVHPGDVLIIPGEAPGPAPQPITAPTDFAKRLAAVAREQHTKFHRISEADTRLCGEIKRWTEAIGADFVSCTSPDHPWSAVFVSWCVKEAGATASEFKFSTAHAAFVHKAIQDADNGRGVFRAFDISAHPPNVGDIIQHNRDGNRFTFDFARRNDGYKSHSFIVAEIRQGDRGPFAICIGGNESDSVRETEVPLTPQGFVRQRGRKPFICVIKTLK